ncbi:thioesterase domain-containing protein [Streptomyces sp. NBC_01102]|uniref:thioesterase II family protein n=1 Tax=Streptomyces sp. NBC_01102 TaxID=2903749 RepID=UPI00386D4B4E|nr:thioesterase domain-containing protein [Streptomyces sp. NBC_01102]
MQFLTREGAEPWLRTYHRGGAPRVRLLCFPFAGGSASMFRGWPALLPAHMAVEAVVLPGREKRLREPPIDRMDVLVAALVAALRPRLDLPYALFGYSFGAQVSFNLAHALRDAGLPDPLGLFVAASAGPSELCDVPGLSETDEELIAYMRALGGTSADVLGNPGLLELTLPALRADLTAVAALPYAARPALNVPIHSFSGEADPTSARPSLMAAWDRETTGGFTQTVFPGGHFFIDHALSDLVLAVRRDLDRLMAEE